MNLEFKDKSGENLKSGDYIVYGHNLGRCAGLRYGKVIEVTEGKHPSEYDKKVTKLKIQGVDDDWHFRRPNLLSRPSFLTFQERVLKVQESQIPEFILTLLEE